MIDHQLALVAIVAAPAWGVLADRLGDMRPPYLAGALWAASAALLLVAGPFFLIIGIHPGFGRVVAIRWFEMLVGVLMKQVAVALTSSSNAETRANHFGCGAALFTAHTNADAASPGVMTSGSGVLRLM